MLSSLRNKLILVFVGLTTVGFILFIALNNSGNDIDVGPIPTTLHKQREPEVIQEEVTIIKKNASHTDQRKQVFFDFGANKGDSLSSFVFSEATQGGDGLIGRGGPNSGQWDIWGFEPNKVFTERLNALADKLKAVTMENGEPQFNVKIFPESVANTMDGKVDFYLDTVNGQFDFWGSSLKSNHPDVIRSKRVTVKVDSYDVARILLENYTKDDYVIIKMDIEGSEFDILARFMKLGVLDLIDEFACEFHDYLAPVPGASNTMQWIMREAGVKLVSWV